MHGAHTQCNNIPMADGGSKVFGLRSSAGCERNVSNGVHDGLWCASARSHPAPSQKLLPVITAAKEPHVTHCPSSNSFTAAACQGVRCATKVSRTLPRTTITPKLTMQLLRSFTLGLMQGGHCQGVHQFCMGWGLVFLA